MLQSLGCIFSCANTRGSPTPVGVTLVPSRTLQSFSAGKHPWGCPVALTIPRSSCPFPEEEEGLRALPQCSDAEMEKVTGQPIPHTNEYNTASLSTNE